MIEKELLLNLSTKTILRAYKHKHKSNMGVCTGTRVSVYGLFLYTYLCMHMYLLRHMRLHVFLIQGKIKNARYSNLYLSMHLQGCSLLRNDPYAGSTGHYFWLSCSILTGCPKPVVL